MHIPVHELVDLKADGNCGVEGGRSLSVAPDSRYERERRPAANSPREPMTLLLVTRSGGVNLRHALREHVAIFCRKNAVFGLWEPRQFAMRRIFPWVSARLRG